ncbi:MAG: DNA repair protein RadA [Nitrospinae bacterium CG11_big_fil_rev_8_21_14_0_20_56_8]|nr:MAG: DNA repair protein RadA [Nitrospinae bacterium CG11_big_fil_rev_8_21_14_0_20_56_8]
MAKSLSVFVCQACGHQAPKWMGKCPGCEGWNTLVEEVEKSPASAWKPAPMYGEENKGAVPLDRVESFEDDRSTTGVGEFDRALGGGLVRGSLVLLGGEPGIGKSTLLLQSMGKAAESGQKVLYVSGEESPAQIKLRAERLGALSGNMYVCSEINIEEVLRTADALKPAILVLDSIQTFYTSDLQSAPGSIGQVREVAFRVLQHVKNRGLPALLIGHITKDGVIAGPKSLEHIVDTVIYFEGERGHGYRILRTIKNRFGPTPELGVFEMQSGGLVPVENPSELFLSDRPFESPGSVIVSSLEGSRPLLIEVQGLVSASTTLGMARRMATGFDPNRMSLLIAIMEKRLGLMFQGEDIFLNIAGGIKVSEPAVDLGVAAAIAGSFKNQPIDGKTVVMGEVGLTGEVRSVMQLDTRIAEAQKLGFTRCVIPQLARQEKSLRQYSIQIQQVKTLSEAFDLLF